MCSSAFVFWICNFRDQCISILYCCCRSLHALARNRTLDFLNAGSAYCPWLQRRASIAQHQLCMKMFFVCFSFWALTTCVLIILGRTWRGRQARFLIEQMPTVFSLSIPLKVRRCQWLIFFPPKIKLKQFKQICHRDTVCGWSNA